MSSGGNNKIGRRIGIVGILITITLALLIYISQLLPDFENNFWLYLLYNLLIVVFGIGVVALLLLILQNETRRSSNTIKKIESIYRGYLFLFLLTIILLVIAKIFRTNEVKIYIFYFSIIALFLFIVILFIEKRKLENYFKL